MQNSSMQLRNLLEAFEVTDVSLMNSKGATTTPPRSEDGSSGRQFEQELQAGEMLVQSDRTRRGRDQRLRCLQVFLALPKALEEFITLAATADENVFILEHRFDDPQDRFGPQVIGTIKALHGFKDFILAQTGVFQGALLKAIVFDQVGLVFLYKPAILPRHLEKFSPGI